MHTPWQAPALTRQALRKQVWRRNPGHQTKPLPPTTGRLPGARPLFQTTKLKGNLPSFHDGGEKSMSVVRERRVGCPLQPTIARITLTAPAPCAEQTPKDFGPSPSSRYTPATPTLAVLPNMLERHPCTYLNNKRTVLYSICLTGPGKPIKDQRFDMKKHENVVGIELVDLTSGLNSCP